MRFTRNITLAKDDLRSNVVNRFQCKQKIPDQVTRAGTVRPSTLTVSYVCAVCQRVCVCVFVRSVPPSVNRNFTPPTCLECLCTLSPLIFLTLFVQDVKGGFLGERRSKLEMCKK